MSVTDCLNSPSQKLLSAAADNFSGENSRGDLTQVQVPMISSKKIKVQTVERKAQTFAAKTQTSTMGAIPVSEFPMVDVSSIEVAQGSFKITRQKNQPVLEIIKQKQLVQFDESDNWFGVEGTQLGKPD